MAEPAPERDGGPGRNMDAMQISLAAVRETLRWEQTFSTSVMANLPGLFMLVDSEGHCRRMNDALAQLLQINRERTVPPPISEWKFLSSESQNTNGARLPVGYVISLGESCQGVVLHHRSNASRIHHRAVVPTSSTSARRSPIDEDRWGANLPRG